MKLSEIIENLKEELERAGDMVVASIELPPVAEGECLDLRYSGYPSTSNHTRKRNGETR